MSGPPIGPSSASTTAAKAARGEYSDSELDTWARRLAQWRRQTEVFAYFNNDWRGYALENARRLKRSLGV